MSYFPRANRSDVGPKENIRGAGGFQFKGLRIDADLIFVLIISVMPLIDSINGLLSKGGSGGALSIGEIYRLVVIATAGCFYLRKFSRGTAIALLVGFTFGLAAILFRVMTGIGNEVSSEINLLVQWMLSPVLVICWYSSVKYGTLKRRSIHTVLDILQWLAPATILIPYIMGVGYSTYGSADNSYVGYKAYYYATNGISLMLIILFARAVYRMFDKRSAISLAIVIMNGVSLALIGTKSSLGMLVLSFFVVLYCKYGDQILRFLARILVLIAILLVVAYFSFDQITEFLAPIIGRWDYFSTRVYSNDLLGALTSGRIYQIGIHWNELASSPMSLLAFLIGMGDLSALYRICEMDYFDMFFQFGVLGLFLLLSFVWFVVSRGYQSNGKRCFELCMVVFLLIYALIVGHVFNNAMSSMVFSLVSVLAMTECEDDHPCELKC